jgi:hypothetical protein
MKRKKMKRLLVTTIILGAILSYTCVFAKYRYMKVYYLHLDFHKDGLSWVSAKVTGDKEFPLSYTTAQQHVVFANHNIPVNGIADLEASVYTTATGLVENDWLWWDTRYDLWNTAMTFEQDGPDKQGTDKDGWHTEYYKGVRKGIGGRMYIVM